MREGEGAELPEQGCLAEPPPGGKEEPLSYPTECPHPQHWRDPGPDPPGPSLSCLSAIHLQVLYEASWFYSLRFAQRGSDLPKAGRWHSWERAPRAPKCQSSALSTRHQCLPKVLANILHTAKRRAAQGGGKSLWRHLARSQLSTHRPFPSPSLLLSSFPSLPHSPLFLHLSLPCSLAPSFPSYFLSRQVLWLPVAARPDLLTTRHDRPVHGRRGRGRGRVLCHLPCPKRHGK